MKGRLRAAFTATSALALLIAGTATVSRRPPPSSTLQKVTASNVPLARAVFARYVTRVRAQGRAGLPSGSETKLAFAGAGIVANVDVRIGQTVASGEALAELDTSALALDAAAARSDATVAAAAYGDGNVPARALLGAQERLALARLKAQTLENGTSTAQSDREAALALVRQSEAKLELDRSAFVRVSALYAAGVTAQREVEAARDALAFDRAEADADRAKATSAISSIGAALAQAHADVAQASSDVLTARAQIKIAQGQSASARARYAAAERFVTLGTLRAPSDGVVFAILKHPGEAVDPTQAVVVVGPRSTTQVTLTVSGSDARDVRPGDAVLMNVAGREAYGNGHVRAVVPRVDLATQATTIVADGLPSGAVSGDALEATIDVGERHGIVIPTSAIVEDPQSGFELVFVRQRNVDGSERFVSRKIAVAAGDDRNTLVASGLRYGERIALDGAFDLLAAP